jgi:hypothetical protein
LAAKKVAGTVPVPSAGSTGGAKGGPDEFPWPCRRRDLDA